MNRDSLQQLHKYNYAINYGIRETASKYIHHKHKMENLKKEAQKYFNKVEDCYDRIALCRYYLDGLTWDRLVMELGYGTPDCIRKRCSRALEKLNKKKL